MKKIIVSVLIFGSLTGETLTWDPPTAHEDGTALDPSELKEYHIYDQRKIIKIVPAPTVSAPISPGTTAHIYEATVVDTKGNQSKFSNAVQWYPTPIPTIQWPPQGPANLNLK